MVTKTEAGAPPASLSVAQLLLGACQTAIREGIGECSRAQGQRGRMHLQIEMLFGDGGELLWVESSLHFSQKRHVKDSARESSDG